MLCIPSKGLVCEQEHKRGRRCLPGPPASTGHPYPALTSPAPALSPLWALDRRPTPPPCPGWGGGGGGSLPKHKPYCSAPRLRPQPCTPVGGGFPGTQRAPGQLRGEAWFGPWGLGTRAGTQAISGCRSGPCPSPAQVPSTAPAHAGTVVLNRALLSTREHSAIAGDILGCHNLG